MTDGSLLAERVVALEQNVISLRSLLEDREKLHAEFRMRTDMRLEVLVNQSSEWAGVRKTLGIMVGLITTIGAVIGWIVHGGFISWTKN